MAVFRRLSERQRLRRATEQALAVPTFRMPEDCTPWVLGGLWPAELTPVTAQTATAAAHLQQDLQRIADTANYELRVLHEAGLPERLRKARQDRVIEHARAFAVQRVASTLRHVRRYEPDGALPPRDTRDGASS